MVIWVYGYIRCDADLLLWLSICVPLVLILVALPSAYVILDIQVLVAWCTNMLALLRVLLRVFLA
jgi:hypothetical protein